MARRIRLTVVVALLLVLAGTGRLPAWAASKIEVVALGDAAPGGGVFAGPGFTTNPSAAGVGWVAFRAQVNDASAPEAIVVAHVTAPVSRTQVAQLGQPAPGWANAKLKQFLGRPVVNSSGDVAFLATTSVKLADKTQQTSSGIFLLHAGQLAAVATSETVLAGEALDLAAPLDSTAEGNLAERSPALNDHADVAFVAVLKETGGAAIFLKPSAGNPVRVIGTGDHAAGGTLGRVGPPALNNAGMVVFHGTVGDPLAGTEGIFSVSGGGSPLLLVASPLALSACDPDAQLTEFDDGLALDDQGTVAFTGGPLGTPSGQPGCPLGDPSFGVVVRTPDGAKTPLACPGHHIASGEIASGAILPPVAGSAVAVPSITPDGTVVFFTSINDGAAGAILRASPGHYDQQPPEVLLRLGGPHADPAPTQGNYSQAASPPAVDASGGVAFLARVLGGSTNEGLFYQPAGGAATAVAVGGQGTPDKGYFAGPSFGAPHLSDGGDVVFRAFVEQAASSVGIFRAHGGAIDAIVRAGDPSPPDPSAPFLNFLGEPSVNGTGSAVFTADVLGHGRGIYLADASGLHALALPGDPVPSPPGATFASLGLNPVINDAGTVAFRGTIHYTDPATQTPVDEDVLFLRDAAGLHKLVGTQESAPSAGGHPFCQLRNPALSGVPSVAFLATFGPDRVADSGIFLAGPGSVMAIALANGNIGNGTFSRFSGTPATDAVGDLTFLANLARGGTPAGQAIVQRSGGTLQQFIASGLAIPVGGSVKTLGAPAMSTKGHVAFRASFVPGTGGTGGYFLAGDHGIALLLAAGELTPGQGRITSFGLGASLNDQDELAFVGNVTGGASPNAIFLASAATLVVRVLRVQITGRGEARIVMQLKLLPGITTNGFSPRTDAVRVSLADSAGPLWSTTVAAGKLKRRGGAFVGGHSKALRALRLVIARGAARVAIRSATIKLKQNLAERVAPPLTVTLNVGGDAATIAVPCQLRADGRRCVWSP